ncbi:electroneutral sodium bicarbonate exchanger 1-like isoform X4 [Sitodiplosis mosellana]|uniref:electroneutral sodium bicarbonate exchanger 1-like isoform X4 n=1 Tax=Sitodiplosis mosellana TaxID=263140 RepID=UPI0024444A38|nr:electroneutral sodium bicarbonate exchanger 1-like isoform X4 [Sitodiplosis mosellana]
MKKKTYAYVPWKMDNDIEAPKDPGVLNQKNSEQDHEVTPPAHRVHSILGMDVDDDGRESHPLFSEMMELTKDGDGIEWKESARWLKFEENVEDGGDRWSKPYVASLSLHSLFELRSLLTNGTIMLDINVNNLEELSDLFCDNIVNAGQLSISARANVRETLLLRHRHQHERKPKKIDNRKLSSPKADGMANNQSQQSGAASTDQSDSAEPQNGSSPFKVNKHFLKKISPGTEANSILIGEAEFLDKTISGLLRLKRASILGDLNEVQIPTRFLFILLGPVGSHDRHREVGRAMATLMSDEIFHEVAYRSKKRDHLLAGVDEFLDAVTVLPPGEWDPTIRIEPPAAIPSQELRKRLPNDPVAEEVDHDEEAQRLREESGLVRSGVLFGGLIDDIRRKAPWYWSDVKDALSSQCIASWVFLYFACLAPIITFGGLIGTLTGNNMAAMESIVSGFVCGIGYGFFSGQPLTILASTGPVLVFEKIVYKFCLVTELDYMSFRFWIGTWISIALLVMVAIDASALVCYITRFTEENFATLVAVIFIYEAILNVLSIQAKFPISSPDDVYDCVCQSPFDENDYNWTKYTSAECVALNGTRIGTDCDKPEPVPNVFLMSIVLFFGTFIISQVLKDFKNALFFPSKVRQLFSDFAVFIAIVSMTVLDSYIKIPTPKLDVPSEFRPTLETRGWIIDPFVNHFWWWLIAFFPAMLGVILIFLDQQITAVIVNRRENKLKKGCGYHLDLFVLAILTQICTTLGLPWFVAATVMSLNHVNSLKLESECAAPGEKPQFLGVREQRVTHVMIFLTIGCSVFLTPLLSHIPMPVLFGVFLYMGFDSLKGLQLFDRILIMFMPVKYQPDFMYLRQVPLKRVHMFTLIQVACLVFLWLIKSYSYTSILFPIMLVVMIGIRRILDRVFSYRELKILDDIMPKTTKRRKNAPNSKIRDKQDQPPPYPGDVEISNEKLALLIPKNPINITAEMNKTTIWKHVNDKNSNEANGQKHNGSSS